MPIFCRAFGLGFASGRHSGTWTRPGSVTREAVEERGDLIAGAQHQRCRRAVVGGGDLGRVEIGGPVADGQPTARRQSAAQRRDDAVRVISVRDEVQRVRVRDRIIVDVDESRAGDWLVISDVTGDFSAEQAVRSAA